MLGMPSLLDFHYDQTRVLRSSKEWFELLELIGKLPKQGFTTFSNCYHDVCDECFGFAVVVAALSSPSCGQVLFPCSSTMKHPLFPYFHAFFAHGCSCCARQRERKKRDRGAMATKLIEDAVPKAPEPDTIPAFHNAALADRSSSSGEVPEPQQAAATTSRSAHKRELPYLPWLSENKKRNVQQRQRRKPSQSAEAISSYTSTTAAAISPNEKYSMAAYREARRMQPSRPSSQDNSDNSTSSSSRGRQRAA